MVFFTKEICMDREVTRINDLKIEELEVKVLELRKRDCPVY